MMTNPILSRAAQNLLNKIPPHLNDKAARLTTQKEISAKLEIPLRTIKRAVKELKANGMLKIQTRMDKRKSGYYFPTLYNVKLLNRSLPISRGQNAHIENSSRNISRGQTEYNLNSKVPKSGPLKHDTPLLYNIIIYI